MLRITIELVPFGNEDEAKKIGEMIIANTSMGKSLSDYEAVIGKDNWSNTPMLTTHIFDWDRSKSVWELVGALLFQAAPNYKITRTKERMVQRLDKEFRDEKSKEETSPSEVTNETHGNEGT